MTAVLEFFNEGGNWFLNITPEISSTFDFGVNIPITDEEKKAIEKLEWEVWE